MTFSVELYDRNKTQEWNQFVRAAKNASFLFEREYMDYHSDRFVDASLMVRDNGGSLTALFPANRRGNRLISHEGLTYGGVLISPDVVGDSMWAILRVIVERARNDGIESIGYKTIPHIYHNTPSEEDRSALFKAGASLVRRDVWSVIDYRARREVQQRRRRSARRAERSGIRVEDTTDFGRFWPVLSDNLQRRYGVLPTHSESEIVLLAARFPESIRLTAAFQGEQLVAGVVVFLSPNVCHVQYPGVSEEGMEVGALDALHMTLIDRYSKSHRYYDFGSSSEDDGRRLNRGLLEYKEGFGARTIVHDFYDICPSKAAESLADV